MTRALSRGMFAVVAALSFAANVGLLALVATDGDLLLDGAVPPPSSAGSDCPDCFARRCSP